MFKQIKSKLSRISGKEKLYLSVIALLILAMFNYSWLFGPSLPNYGKAQSPTVVQEFRAAWIASVANINWPSEPGLSVAEQQQEAIALLDHIAEANLNAVILQVRPHADALYLSELESWSYYLTGEQGQAPEPFYDPLTFWIEEAHSRGLELHAWINPYRAHHYAAGEVSQESIVYTKPHLVAELHNGMQWMNPTHQETINHSIEVIKDLVSRYDIDGIHYDDYFYPYPSYNNGEDFPDHQQYLAYQAQGGELSLGDWRRQAVNLFVESVYQQVKSLKPWVKVGISPFGIWRPGYPQSIAGLDQYATLYADAKLWFNQGWLDYFTPQLYWPVNQVQQSFAQLLVWWQQQNFQKRHFWPGLSSNKVKTLAGIDEVVNQIMIARALLQPNAGQVFWNVFTISQNPQFKQILANNIYNNQALVPPSPWLDNIPPTPPVVTIDNGSSLNVSWQNLGEEAVFRWVLYYQQNEQWQYRIFNRDTKHFQFLPTDKVTAVAVVAVDRSGMQSLRFDIDI
ncbi:glycoside hydrolase family 10 protein [Paraglaciecola aestuariivivens]